MDPAVTLCNLTSNPWQTVVNIYLSVMFYVVSQTKFSSSSPVWEPAVISTNWEPAKWESPYCELAVQLIMEGV